MLHVRSLENIIGEDTDTEDGVADEYGPANPKNKRFTSAKLWGTGPVTSDETFNIVKESSGNVIYIYIYIYIVTLNDSIC